MTMAYSEEEKQAVRAALAAGEAATDVSLRTGVALALVLRWGESVPGPSLEQRRRNGRKPVLDDADLAVIRERVVAHPATTLVEFVALLAERTGKSVSVPPVARALKKLGFEKVKPVKAASTPSPQTAPRYGKEHRREPTEGKYPSSMTEAEWTVIEPLLTKARDPRGRKPKHDRRWMMDTVFYLVRSGCQWRMLPKDFPPWQAVWSVFRRLRDSGVLERLYEAFLALWRLASSRKAEPTAGIVDSQSVKTTEKEGLAAATTRARRPRAANDIWSSTFSGCPAPS